MSLSAVVSLPSVRSAEATKGINNNKIGNNIHIVNNAAAADNSFKLPLPFDLHTALKQAYGKAAADDASGNNFHARHRTISHSSKHSGNNSPPNTASDMRKCISNTPQGGAPRITRQGNTITGTDCDDNSW